MRAGRFIAAAEITASRDEDHSFACFGGNGSRGFVARATHDGSFVLIGRQGALCGNVRRVRGRFYATEHAVVVSPTAGLDANFLYHMLERMNLNQYATVSAQPGLAVRTLADVAFPIPPLAEQARIVAILDKFDALVNDLSVGLPAELAARRKQYEHYRDRLLTFKEAVA